MKTFPLTLNQIQTLATQFPTPFHLYDETAIRDNARRLTRAFSILPGFREFFAVKATPNPFLLRILASEGFGADCSSLAELRLCEAVGITGERIMFTSNETPDEEFRVARDLGAIINLDDITHMDALIAATGSLPKTLCFRYNPGPLKAGNAIIGKPEEAVSYTHLDVYKRQASALGERSYRAELFFDFIVCESFAAFASFALNGF